MSIKETTRAALLQLRPVRRAWGAFRRWQLHRQYDERREHYHRAAEARKLVYTEAGTMAAVRARLRERGYTPSRRRVGEVHTFAFIPQVSWHPHLLPDLHALGRVTPFDYAALGFRWEEFARAGRRGLARRKAMNDLVLPALRKAHAERPVDWVYVYATGLELSAAIVQRITEELGVPTVNMCLDDKQSWTGPWMGDHSGGQVGLASCFDLSWTSARVACEWYLVEGGRPLYLPEGFDASAYRPMEVGQDLPVSFIGGAYGFRPEVVRHLQRNCIPIHLFGPGWGTQCVWGKEQVLVLNRSLVNLGMGGIGYSESLTNVKTRDFEIPGTGGGAYLTTYNPDLALHFVVGREILCYHSRDEMLEQIRYCLAHRDEARKIARQGRERCLREHRWLHRYQKILAILGVMDTPAETVQARAGAGAEQTRQSTPA